LAVGGGAWRVARTWGGARTLRWPRHDLLSPLRGRPKYAVVSNEVSPRRRHQRGETAEQLARLDDEDLAAVAEAPFHAVREFGVGKRREPLLREPRRSAITAQVSQALPVVCMQMDTGVQREALVVRGEVPAFAFVWRLATQGRHRLGLRRGERVGRPCIFSQRVEPRLEESADAALQGAQDLGHVVIGQAGKRHELDAAFFTDPNAVRDDAMEMNVQVERAAETLHEGDRACSGAANSHPARA